MRLLYLAGWLLLSLAFLGGAAEIAAQATDGHGFVLSSIEVWSTLWPDTLAGTRSFLPDWLWEAIAKTLLMLPPWALFGIPGGLLAWFAHPERRTRTDADDDPDSLFLYDALARRAQEDGFDSDDDRLPSHAIADDFDPGTETIGRAEDDFDPDSLLGDHGTPPVAHPGSKPE